MKFFIDTADIPEIQRLAETGLVDGVTTNPTSIAKFGQDMKTVIAEICDLVDGPISAEVVATDYDTMLKEADVLRNISPQVAIKVPLTVEGLKACRKLTDEDTMVNVTLCFSATQALLAAKAGATFISPFMGRLDDTGLDGAQLIEDVCTLYDTHGFETQVLAASVRSPVHVFQAAVLGADIATFPPKVLDQLYKHPLTDKGLSAFLAD